MMNIQISHLLVTTNSDVWMLDSAFSYHMCLDLEWLFDFKELKSGDVYTGNNNPLTRYGNGSVQFRNHDELIITLHDVHYVLNLMKNLMLTNI